MNAVTEAKQKIKGRKLRLVLPEGDEQRIREAADVLQAEDLATPILLTESKVDPARRHAELVMVRRPKMTEAMALRLLQRPLFLAGAMVAAGEANAMIAGATHSTARVIEAAQMTIGLAPGISQPSSFFLMQWPDRRMLFADCAVNIQPSAEELASIAIASAASARKLLEVEPRIAMLSFSTKGSADHADAEKVVKAVALARQQRPDLMIDGEMQGDAALSSTVAARKIKGGSDVAGQANVLVFPDLDAGNIAYKLVQYLAGAEAMGPILQGFAKPVSDLSRGAGVEEIVSTAAILLSMTVDA